MKNEAASLVPTQRASARSTRQIGSRIALALALALPLGALAPACSGAQSGGRTSDYSGTVTVTNQSGLRVCHVAPETSSSSGVHPAINEEIAPGASATFTVTRGFNRLQVVECETNRLLYGDPLAWLNSQQLHSGQGSLAQVTLLAPGSSAPSGDNGWSVVLEPLDQSTAVHHLGVSGLVRRGLTGDETFMNDWETAGRALDLLRAAARSAGWRETYTAAFMISDDWEPLRQRMRDGSTPVVARRAMFIAGARYGTDYCMARSHDVRQPFDGSSETGPVQLGGLGNAVQVPCSLVEAMESAPGASTGN